MVLGVTLVGESLNDVLNPLLRTRAGGGASADEKEVAGEFEAAVSTDSVAGPDAADAAGGAATKIKDPAEITEPVVVDAEKRQRVATLSLQDLTVRFDTDAGIVHAVNGVSFAVEEGEVVAVVGESGSGKSVSSRAMLGLLPSTAHTTGSARLRDRELLGLSPRALRPIRGDQVSMIFQEPSTALNPVYTVGWQICEGIRAHRKISRKEARQRAIELLELVGLPDPERRVDYYPHQLSGGQKQRVVIAMAISCEPDVIIADEPTTALDVTVQAAILELLLSLRDRLGTAIVLITHNMGVVADVADRVVVMYQGRVVEEAPVDALFAAPQHPYTQRLLDAVPHLGRGVAATPAAQTQEQIVLTVDDLVVEFPGRLGQPSFRAVDGVSFEIRRGEVLGLVGESGSGKSTVGRTTVGLQKPTSGSVTVSGTEISQLTDAQLRTHRGHFGFVFQDPAASLNPHLTITDCVAEPLHVQGRLSAGEQRAKVRQLLDRVQLPGNYADRYPHELSGGQRQRVSLARALALDPELLIADEPTSALDVSVQARVLELFDELQSELQFACLFISHDLAVVDSLAHRVAVMQYGEIVEIGPAHQVLNDPQQDYTKRLIAAVPVPDPVEQRHRREARGKLLTDVS
ncbi:ABC transporter ATP-binding protein [Microlunatus elymi]|uniref:ABC transporter ATP-binding protein n=2 Tax=Microlunatus elymi TaxID=2596828 RepID=A0A516Q5G7_9ACTN|nr:ABC transporter ATP-binding protein [Microlunatus elymi]